MYTNQVKVDTEYLTYEPSNGLIDIADMKDFYGIY